MILESNLIIPNDKQYTSMSTYIDFEFESSGLIDVNTYILLDLENEFVYSDTIQIQRVNGCGSADITFSVTIPNENILNISESTCQGIQFSGSWIGQNSILNVTIGGDRSIYACEECSFRTPLGNNMMKTQET